MILGLCLLLDDIVSLIEDKEDYYTILFVFIVDPFVITLLFCIYWSIEKIEYRDYTGSLTCDVLFLIIFSVLMPLFVSVIIGAFAIGVYLTYVERTISPMSFAPIFSIYLTPPIYKTLCFFSSEWDKES